MVSVAKSALKVLVVEEDEYFRLQLVISIKAIGYLVYPINNHSEALSTISSFLPDLVIMGLDTPDKQLFFNYAQSLKYRTPPILFITDFNKKNFYSSLKGSFHANEENIRKVIKKKVAALETQQRIGNNILCYNDFLFFAKRGIYDKTNIKDILYFKAIDDYALIITPEKAVTIFSGIKELKGLLQQDFLFVQIHRSYLVNAQKSIRMDFTTNTIYINKEHAVPLSRRLKKNVVAWFKLNDIPLVTTK